MKSILWFLIGPMASLAIGYAIFFILVFMLAGGINIDSDGTAIEQFFAKIAIPAFVIIAFTGSAFSLVMCIRYIIMRRSITSQ